MRKLSASEFPMRGPMPTTSTGNLPTQPPPGGSAAISQQTQAAQLNSVLFAPGFGRAASRPRRKVRSASKRGGSRKSKRVVHRRSMRKAKKARRFVKGSAEAKRFMAKLRRMQKRKKRG